MQTKAYLIVAFIATFIIGGIIAKPSSTGCLPGETVTPCFVDPCLRQTCPLNPKATCVASYCNGCNFYWLNSDNEPVFCGCPKDNPQVYCFRDPCQGICPKGANCLSNYCGGCACECYNTAGMRIPCGSLADS